jgi:UDP-N-acetyl-2-amino-2-deoxyglucuronate dehydrogenase
VTGSQGTAILEQDRLVSVEVKTPSDADRWRAHDEARPDARATSPVVSDASGHRRVFEDFFCAIETNGRPACDGREGRRSVAVVEAIYASARSGRAVDTASVA